MKVDEESLVTREQQAARLTAFLVLANAIASRLGTRTRRFLFAFVCLCNDQFNDNDNNNKRRFQNFVHDNAKWFNRFVICDLFVLVFVAS